MPCNPVEVNWHFRGSYLSWLQVWRVRKTRNEHETGSDQSFLLGLLFSFWNEYSMPLQDVAFYRPHSVPCQKTQLFTVTGWELVCSIYNRVCTCGSSCGKVSGKPDWWTESTLVYACCWLTHKLQRHTWIPGLPEHELGFPLQSL